MYRAALVALKPGSANEAVSQIALELAQRRQLRLSAIAVVDPARVAPAEPVPIGASAFKAHRDSVLLGEARQAARLALDVFAQQCRIAGVECDVLFREGSLDIAIASATHGVDLLLAGHTAGTDTNNGAQDPSPLDIIVKHAPRPAIVVPRVAADATRIVVAYDASAQAARALHDFATSGLWQDIETHVISFEKDITVAAETAERAASYLQLHQGATHAHPAVARQDVAQQILDAARQLDAGMLVMGAYGKPSWREFVFGSVTRTVLRAVTIPVFISH